MWKLAFRMRIVGVGSSGARWLLDQLHYLWVISQSICPSVTHLIPWEQKCGEKKLVGRREDAAGSSHMGLPCLQLFTDHITYTPSLGVGWVDYSTYIELEDNRGISLYEISPSRLQIPTFTTTAQYNTYQQTNPKHVSHRHRYITQCRHYTPVSNHRVEMVRTTY